VEEAHASEVREWQMAVPLWGQLLRSNEPVLLVFSNTVFHGTYQEGMRLFNSLDVMESGGGAPALTQGNVNNPSALPMIDHYTGIGEVMGVHYLGDFFTRMHQPSRLKRSLLLNWDDAKAENIVVLGSPAENFFLLDLPQQQDFVFRWMTDGQQRHVNAIVNTNTQTGNLSSQTIWPFAQSDFRRLRGGEFAARLERRKPAAHSGGHQYVWDTSGGGIRHAA
jgi:hypothetical protein